MFWRSTIPVASLLGVLFPRRLGSRQHRQVDIELPPSPTPSSPPSTEASQSPLSMPVDSHVQPLDHTEPDQANRRERLARSIVESMNQLGFLSSSYTYTVLPASDTGLSYVVLMQLGFDPELMPSVIFADAEHMLRHRSMGVYGLAIRAVYWRRSERLALHINQSTSVLAPLPDRLRAGEHGWRHAGPGTVDQVSAFAALN